MELHECVTLFCKYATVGAYVQETNIIRNNLKNDDVFVDIGANIGYYTLLASQILGEKGKVYSFEPTSSHYKMMISSIKKNKFKNIIPYNLAVSDSNSYSKIYLNYKNFGNISLIAKNVRYRFLFEYIDCVDGKKFFKKEGIESINFLKIDVEGFENIVLNNLQEIILNNMQHLIIMLEIWNKNLVDQGKFKVEVKKILDSFTYIYFINKQTGKIELLNGLEDLKNLSQNGVDMLNILLSNSELKTEGGF